MSGHPSSAQQQRKCPTGGDGRQSSTSGGQAEVYLHLVTDEIAALLLKDRDVKKKSGADVEFDPNPSPVPDMKILQGGPSQIEEAVNLVNQKTGSEETLPDQAQTFWLQWVEAAFPDLDSRAYFLPPVYFNRVPMTRETVAGQDVLVLQPGQPGQSGQPVQPGQSGQTGQSGQSGQPVQSGQTGQTGQKSHPVKVKRSSADTSIPQPRRVQDSDLRDDAAMQRVLMCLQKLSEDKKEVMVGLTQLQFGEYLGEPCYAAAAAQLPLAANLPCDDKKFKQGDFDVLLIHRLYGLIVLEVKAFGDNVKTLNMDVDNHIKEKLTKAMSQLNKAGDMLSHLVSDIAKGLPVTKVIAFPNLTASQLQQAISGKVLIQDLCRCLGTKNPADIAGLCLCSDQLSDPKTPCDVSSPVLKELWDWWQRRVAGAGHDSHMTPEVYKKLVARFCGPATSVTVPCTSPPRVRVKTLGQAVSHTGQCYTAVITLFPEQLHLLNTAPPTLFVAGPPGTGKSVMLLLKAIEWMRCGHPVHIVSTGDPSRAACIMLYHLLLQTVNTQQSADVSRDHPALLVEADKDVDKVVNDLSQAASGGPLYVIADEVESDFKTFCDKLLTQVPDLHLWAASCHHGFAPTGWQVLNLTRPLRSPPAVVREVEQDKDIAEYHVVKPYSKRGVADHTDGPPVKRVYHPGQGHSAGRPDECVKCIREVASILHSLRAGVKDDVTTSSTTVTPTSSGTAPPCLQWRDMLVLHAQLADDDISGMVKTLKEAGIPAREMTRDTADIKDVATAHSDVVWVAHGALVRGLERKVVVSLYLHSLFHLDQRLNNMSRCTSQLVIIPANVIYP